MDQDDWPGDGVGIREAMQISTCGAGRIYRLAAAGIVRTTTPLGGAPLYCKRDLEMVRDGREGCSR